MNRYLKINDTQNYITDYYKKNSIKIDFPSAVAKLIEKNMAETVPPSNIKYENLSKLNDDEFFKALGDMYLTVNEDTLLYSENNIGETRLFPSPRDVFLLHNFNDVKNNFHTHNFFELDYVYDGECDFYFENEHKVLKRGDAVIIAPSSKHNVYTRNKNDKFIYVLIRKSTFQSVFFSLLSRRDSLSIFFRAILHESENPNYLLVSMEHTPEISIIMKNLIIENYRNDEYSNSGCIALANLFFIYMLRHHNRSISFYHYNNSSDSSEILYYIERHFHNLTLEKLASHFGYSVPYLSSFIVKNLGINFTELIRNFKMAEAEEFLLNTTMSVSKIAEVVGYSSADHFTRVFKSVHNITPLDFRYSKIQNKLV